MQIHIKRIYEGAAEEDGVRILVDRIWPRGISKEKAKLDAWIKDIGPSSELRKWFGHKEERFREFKERYEKELSQKQDLLEEIWQMAAGKTLTLLYSAKDTRHNQAVVLREFLQKNK